MEPIHWHALTPAQRDEVVHEKVFGHERTIKHFLAPDYSHVWSIGEHYKINSYQTWQTGGPHTPCYSRSLDDAWLVLQEMVSRRKTDERTFVLFADQLFDMASQRADDADWSAAWGDYILAAQWTPEAICVAALRALGYEVVIEEVKVVE